MASSYPSGLDSFSTIATDKLLSDAVGGRTHRAMHNDLGDAIEAVQAELGTNPSGQAATVAARLANQAVINVKDYGATGDGVTDDTAAIQAAVDAAAGSASVLFPAGVYKLTSTVEVPATSHLVGQPGAEIKYTTTGPDSPQSAFTITGSDVTIEDLTITGPRTSAATLHNEWGIDAQGASTAARLERIVLRRLTMSMWGRACIRLRWVTGFTVSGCHLYDAGFQGFVGMSVSQGVVADNHVHDILCGFDDNGYGITFYSYDLAPADETTDPVCSDIEVRNNTVERVSQWEGIDFHGGHNIKVVGNTVLGCRNGIDISGDVRGMTDLLVANNFIDSMTDTSEDGTVAYGITCWGTEDVPVSGAVISNNVIRRHTGGITLNRTSGIVVSANTLDTCSVVGMILWDDNAHFVIAGNSFIDLWSASAGSVCAVMLYQNDNVGLIADNIVARGEKSATYINKFGVRDQVGTAGGSNVLMSGNDFRATDYPTWSSGTQGLLTRVNEKGGKLGFFGAAPVVQPVANADTSGASLGDLETEVNQLKALLRSLGLMAAS